MLTALMFSLTALAIDSLGLESVPTPPVSTRPSATVSISGTVDGGIPMLLVPLGHGDGSQLERTRFYDERGRVFARSDVLRLLASEPSSASRLTAHDDARRQSMRYLRRGIATMAIPGVGTAMIFKSVAYREQADDHLQRAIRDYNTLGPTLDHALR
jgi:hypothetical protein